MTSPEEAIQVLDVGNNLLAKVPITLAVGTLDTPDDGQLGVLTWRSGTTTFTVMGTPAELQGWVNQQVGMLSVLSKSGLAVVRQPLSALDLSGGLPHH